MAVDNEVALYDCCECEGYESVEFAPGSYPEKPPGWTTTWRQAPSEYGVPPGYVVRFLCPDHKEG